MWQRQDGQAAHANEQKAEQKRYGEQATFVIDHVARNVGARDPNRDHSGSDKRG
jgi:hypothetical protein